MSDTRHPVRVRRSPRIGVFLVLGAVVGLVTAVVVVGLTPADPDVPTPQALGFIALLLTPVGGLLGGAVALVLEAVGERRARTVQAERIRPEPGSAPEQEPGAGAGDGSGNAESVPLEAEGDAR